MEEFYYVYIVPQLYYLSIIISNNKYLKVPYIDRIVSIVLI